MTAVEQAAVASRRDRARAGQVRLSDWLASSSLWRCWWSILAFRVGGAHGEVSRRAPGEARCGLPRCGAASGNSADGSMARAWPGPGVWEASPAATRPTGRRRRSGPTWCSPIRAKDRPSLAPRMLHAGDVKMTNVGYLDL